VKVEIERTKKGEYREIKTRQPIQKKIQKGKKIVFQKEKKYEEK